MERQDFPHSSFPLPTSRIPSFSKDPSSFPIVYLPLLDGVRVSCVLQSILLPLASPLPLQSRSTCVHPVASTDRRRSSRPPFRSGSTFSNVPDFPPFLFPALALLFKHTSSDGRAGRTEELCLYLTYLSLSPPVFCALNFLPQMPSFIPSLEVKDFFLKG